MTVSISLDFVSFCLFLWLLYVFSYVLSCFVKFLIPPTKVVTEIELYSFFMHSKIEYRNNYCCRKTASTLIMIYFIWVKILQNIQLLEYPLAFIEMPWVSIRLYNTQYLQETFHLYPIHRPLPYTFTKFHYLWII